MKLIKFAALSASVLLLAACGDQGTSTNEPPAQPAPQAQVAPAAPAADAAATPAADAAAVATVDADGPFATRTSRRARVWRSL